MPRKKAEPTKKRKAAAAGAPMSLERHGAGALSLTMMGRRPYQEDRVLVVPHAAVLGAGRGLYAVFDGHGGSGCSQYLVDELMGNLPSVVGGAPPLPGSAKKATPGKRRSSRARAAAQASKDAGAPAAVADALREAVLETDAAYCELARNTEVMDGSTCVVVYVSSREGEEELVVSNTGDSRAVLVRAGGAAVALTEDHSPENKKEQARIRRAGGTVKFDAEDDCWRVDGMLAVSRAVGDVYVKPYVTAEPDVLTFKRSAKVRIPEGGGGGG
jgi:serine/threonine protein phosphatase PrpC